MGADAGTTEVRKYYDTNTRSFLRWGQGRGTGTIRRAIRGPGVTTRSDAFHFVDAEICRKIEFAKDAPTRIVDLGCGVGGSLSWIAERYDIEGTGVTLSPVQARIASGMIEGRAGRLRGRASFVASDIYDFAPPVPQDAAIAIESFVHVPDAARFFRHARALLRPAGILVVVDDFLVSNELSTEGARIVHDFRRGWRIQTLVTPDEAVIAARAAGFELVDQTDLTPYLELGRPRDVIIRRLVDVMRWFPSLDRRPALANLIGGDALQRGLETGVLTHRFVTFRAAP
jgi:SAM-dependent methyltransferase